MNYNTTLDENKLINIFKNFYFFFQKKIKIGTHDSRIFFKKSDIEYLFNFIKKVTISTFQKKQAAELINPITGEKYKGKDQYIDLSGLCVIISKNIGFSEQYFILENILYEIFFREKLGCEKLNFTISDFYNINSEPIQDKTKKIKRKNNDNTEEKNIKQNKKTKISEKNNSIKNKSLNNDFSDNNEKNSEKLTEFDDNTEEILDEIPKVNTKKIQEEDFDENTEEDSEENQEEDSEENQEEDSENLKELENCTNNIKISDQSKKLNKDNIHLPENWKKEDPAGKLYYIQSSKNMLYFKKGFKENILKKLSNPDEKKIIYINKLNLYTIILAISDSHEKLYGEQIISNDSPGIFEFKKGFTFEKNILPLLLMFNINNTSLN